MLTVLLATRDRAETLRDVLECFCRLERPSSGWKLVLVDNGSVDRTAQVVASFSDRLPLHAVFEPQPGKNRALNAGLALVEGDLTVLTDDDVFPHAAWLNELQTAARTQPEYSIFGGAIVARWEEPPPPWIGWVEPGPAYALTDPSLKEGPLPASLIFGPNMAIRTNIFEAGIRFDPAMGPRGSSYPMGSETELVLRLAGQGHKAWHAPEAVVEHFIRKEQLTAAWVRQRAIRYGRGKCRLAALAALPGSADAPPPALRMIVKEALLIGAAWARRRPDALFRARWRFNYWRGQAMEARILARDARSARQASSIAPEQSMPASRATADSSAPVKPGSVAGASDR